MSAFVRKAYKALERYDDRNHERWSDDFRGAPIRARLACAAYDWWLRNL